MSEPVKRRSYDSSRRQEQARQSRARVLAAARRRFLDEGYAAAALPAVAADAGVSVESIYKAFRNKAGVLKAVFDVAVAGDDEPVAIMDRAFVARNPGRARRRARSCGCTATTSSPRCPAPRRCCSWRAPPPRSTPTWPPSGQQLQHERLVGMTAFATDLVGTGRLRAGSRRRRGRATCCGA